MKRFLSYILFLFCISYTHAKITLVQDQCVPYPNQTLSTLSEITLTIDGTDEISAAGISPDQARLLVTTKSIYVYEDGVAVAYNSNTDIVKTELGVMTITLPLTKTLTLEKGKEYVIKTKTRKIRIQDSTGDWNSSFLDATEWSIIGDSSGGTDFGNVAISLNPEDSKFADGATFDKIEASAWADKGDETLLQPGDAGTWYYNITSDKVDPLPEMYVTYKFKALDNQEWASDNNGEIGFRIAKKTDNGYLCHLWTNYAEPLLNNRTVEFTVEVRENADGKLLASQTSTWTGTLKATLTAKKLHFNPESESELNSQMTIVTLTADEPLSKAIAYSPELIKLDEQTRLPEVVAPREDYTVSKVSDTEWLIILNPSANYLEKAKGDIRMAVTAWDINGVKMLYDEYVTVLYSYPSSLPHIDLTVSPATGSTVETLASFAVDYERTGKKEMGREWNTKAKATLTGKDYSYEFDEASVSTYSIPVDKRPTEPGLYTLTIPKDYLLIGDDDPTHSAELVATYAYIPKTEYVNLAYQVKTIAKEETSESSSNVQVVKGEAYSFKVDKAESEDWAVTVEGATLDEATGLYSTGALEADTAVVVTYTYTVPEVIIPEYVSVTYNVSSKVGEAETAVSGNTSLIEKGKAFTADINVLDENWTAEVTGATLAEGKVATEALNEDATVEVVYVYNGKIVVIDDETTGAEGVEVDGLKVESVGGKIIVSGLNSGEMAMLYGMNAALLANGTAVYNTVEFEAPAGVAYIVSVVHNGNKLGFKILNK